MRDTGESELGLTIVDKKSGGGACIILLDEAESGWKELLRAEKALERALSIRIFVSDTADAAFLGEWLTLILSQRGAFVLNVSVCLAEQVNDVVRGVTGSKAAVTVLPVTDLYRPARASEQDGGLRRCSISIVCWQ